MNRLATTVVATLILAVALAPTSHAATVQLSLDVDQLTKSFDIVAEILDPDNVVEEGFLPPFPDPGLTILGISSLQFDVFGRGNVEVTSLDLMVPNPAGEGFVFQSTSPIEGGFTGSASQLAFFGPPAATPTSLVIEGVGIGPTVVASGTYSGGNLGGVNTLSVQDRPRAGGVTGFDLLYGDSAEWDGAFVNLPDVNDIEPAEAVLGDIIPEPTSVLVWSGLIASMCLGTCYTRPRRK